jgi:hypothetical protein
MKIFERVLHAAAVVVVGLGAIVAIGVFALSRVVSLFLVMKGGKSTPASDYSLNWVLICVAFTLVGCGYGIYRRIAWRWIALVGSGVVGALGYLAWDVAPVPLVDLGPRVSGGDAGYRTIMWMAEKSPYSRLAEAGVLTSEKIKDLTLPSGREAWPEFVQAKRAEILQAWDADKLGKEWFSMINVTPPKGIWPQGFNDPIIDFRSVRAVSNIHRTYAYLLARDGRREEAMAVLLPMVQAMHQLERTSGSLLHGMIATVVLKGSYATLDEILKLGAISPEIRVKVRDELLAAMPVSEVIHHILLGEQAFLRGCLNSVEPQSIPKLSSGSRLDAWISFVVSSKAGCLLFNRNRTEQMGLKALEEITALAAAREFDGLKAWRPPWYRVSESRNPVGRLLIAMWMPAFTKATEGLWENEDQRLALLKQLADTP